MSEAYLDDSDDPIGDLKKEILSLRDVCTDRLGKIKSLESQLKECEGDDVWVQDKDGDHFTWRMSENWTIEEPRKKPSERIHEFARKEPYKTLEGHTTMLIVGILDYLDEEYEKSEKRDK